MSRLEQLCSDPRTTVRRAGAPDPRGRCVVYWMQRAQRGVDNPALDTAVNAANLLGKPVVVFFAPRPFPPANLRHYAFLEQGIADIAETLEKRGIGFVLRRFPDHSLLKFCEEVKPALVVGDENPLRQAEAWRATAAKKLKVPLWTVDADLIVPSKLLEKEQYAAFIIRPRLQPKVDEFLAPSANPKTKVPWNAPAGLVSLPLDCAIAEGWNIDRSVPPVASWKGGTKEGLRLLRHFVRHNLATYSRDRNHPELDGTARLSPYLHFGHISPATVALAIKSADAPESDFVATGSPVQ